MGIVHQKNKKTGVIYVYESEAYWDAEKKQSRSRRKCIGKLDPETGVLVPSKKYQMSLELEQVKKQPGRKATKESRRLFFGSTYLFDSIGEKLGLKRDLDWCFPDESDRIQSVAYYLLMEPRNALSRFSKWSKTHVHPYGRDIASQRSSELFRAIDEHGKQRFFQAQSERRSEEEYLVYDTTSISSYSKAIKLVKWGKNKENDRLPQLNLAMVYGQKSRLPVYYRKLPGNISDVSTVRNLIADLDEMHYDKVQLIMDRGFYSEANVNALYQNHIKFLMGTRIGLKFVQVHLDQVRESMKGRSSYSSAEKLHYHSEMIRWQYEETKKRSQETIHSEKRMYLHLYYDEQRAIDDKLSFHALLDQLEEELISGNRRPSHEKLYAKYYQVHSTPKRGTKLIPKQELMDEAVKNYGYFTLVSNSIKDPMEALDIYRGKDLIEKGFGNLKERLNMRRTSVSSEENLEGKLFVQFIALIYLSHIDKIMREHKLYKKYTLQGLLDELDVIERYETPGRLPHIGKMTKKQKEIFQAFGIDIPQ